MIPHYSYTHYTVTLTMQRPSNAIINDGDKESKVSPPQPPPPPPPPLPSSSRQVPLSLSSTQSTSTTGPKEIINWSHAPAKLRSSSSALLPQTSSPPSKHDDEDSSGSEDDEAEGAILLEAVEHGSVKQVQRIMKYCEGDRDVVTCENYEKRTPLHLAALMSRPIVMETLLENKYVVALANRRDIFGCTPLLLVCVYSDNEENKMKCAQQLIASGALCQLAWTHKMQNCSALHWCALHGYSRLAALLTKYPGSLILQQKKDYKHRLPMDVAGGELMELRHHHVEQGEKVMEDHRTIQRLKERDATLRSLVINSHLHHVHEGGGGGGPTLRVLQSQLCWGSYLGLLETIHTTLSYSAKRIQTGQQSINLNWSKIYSHEGMTALHFASHMGQDKIIDTLVTFHREHCCGPPKSKLIPTVLFTADHWGNTPLHLASMWSNFPNFGPTQHTISRLLSSGKKF